ncbi:MAG TPA: hypothetical protein PKL52_06035 [Tenuifilaceae bacterium]|jgi:hypothetical protein|nr:hypothetical protein [Tenuifilaceae bacterium]
MENRANELREKILHGVNLAFKRLMQTKQKEDAEVAISKNGKPVRVKATELQEV